MTVRAYPAYRDSKSSLLGLVPEHWSARQIKHIARLAYGESLPADGRNEDGLFKVFGSNGAIGTHGIANTSKPVIIVGRKGSHGALNWSDDPVFAIDTAYYIDKTCSNCNMRWLFWALQAANLSAFSQDTGVPGLARELVHSLAFVSPSEAEQSAIAVFLDRETGKIDALVAEQERLIALLKEKRQAVISHAVTKGLKPNAPMKDSGVAWLGEVPAHWEIRSISSVTTKITNGYVGPTRDILVSDGVRYLQSLHIKQNQISFHTPYYVSSEWSAEHRKSVLSAGDVLVVQTGDIGQTAVVTNNFAGCNCHALIILTPESSCLTGHWLSWVLNSSLGQQTLASIQTGALHPHLNCGDVKDIRIPLPPISEQRELAERIERVNESLMQLDTEATRAITLLRERRAALISAAVTGKIDVRDTVPAIQAAA